MLNLTRVVRVVKQSQHFCKLRYFLQFNNCINSIILTFLRLFERYFLQFNNGRNLTSHPNPERQGVKSILTTLAPIFGCIIVCAPQIVGNSGLVLVRFLLVCGSLGLVRCEFEILGPIRFPGFPVNRFPHFCCALF